MSAEYSFRNLGVMFMFRVEPSTTLCSLFMAAYIRNRVVWRKLKLFPNQIRKQLHMNIIYVLLSSAHGVFLCIYWSLQILINVPAGFKE